MAEKISGARETEASKILDSSDEAALQRYREQRRPQLFGVEGTVRERMAETDRFDLTKGGTIDPETLYNDVGPERMVTQLAHPDHWSKFGEPDQVADFLARVPGAKIVTHKGNGKEVREWDGVIVSYPKVIHDDFLEDDRQAAEAHDALIDDQDGERRYTVLDDEYNPQDKQQRQERIRTSINALRSGGLIGPTSPTREMDYRTALRTIPQHEREAKEAELRRGPRSENEHADKAAMEQFQAKLEQERNRQAGRKSFGGLGGSPTHNKWTTSKDAAKAGK